MLFCKQCCTALELAGSHALKCSPNTYIHCCGELFPLYSRLSTICVRLRVVVLAFPVASFVLVCGCPGLCCCSVIIPPNEAVLV